MNFKLLISNKNWSKKIWKNVNKQQIFLKKFRIKKNTKAEVPVKQILVHF